jgi:hypothetical protein
MSSRGIFAICLVAIFLSVSLAPFPNARHLLWTFTLWSLFLGSVLALIGVAANLAGVLALMYFGYAPGKRLSRANVLPFISWDDKKKLMHEKQPWTQEAGTPDELVRELERIEDVLSSLKSMLAFHRLSEEQRHQYDRVFAELEVLIQQLSIAAAAQGEACSQAVAS